MDDFLSNGVLIACSVIFAILLWLFATSASIWALNTLGFHVEYGLMQRLAISVLGIVFKTTINIKNN